MKKSTKKSVRKTSPKKKKANHTGSADKADPLDGLSPEGIEAIIRQSADRLVRDGIPEADAMNLARQVFADIHVIQRMVLHCPHFNEILDLLEMTDGMPVLDSTHQFRVRLSGDRTYTIRTMHDLIFRMYVIGYFHGYLLAKADDNIDADFEHDILMQSKENAENLMNTITRAYDALIDVTENNESSITVESVYASTDVPMYPNTSVDDF